MSGSEDRPNEGRPELPRITRVPGGVFVLGHDAIAEAEAPNPRHRVELSPFWIGVHPVTCAEYAAFVAATGAPPPAELGPAAHRAPDCPVTGVSFADARRYCAWAGGALPTESQWELAASAGDGRRFPWGDEPPDQARACFGEDWNRGGPSRIGTHAAGAGPFGCHDLAGNVWEWCLDVFRADAHVELERMGVDPCVGGAGRVRPLRGGCWRSIECKLQVAYRNWSHEAARHTTMGFRLCVPTRAQPA